jgi:hypothetical protein
MRKKFKIFYGENNAKYPERKGQQYKTKGKDMLVMNDSGVFLIFNGEPYYPSIRSLSAEIGSYDVVWNEGMKENLDIIRS